MFLETRYFSNDVVHVLMMQYPETATKSFSEKYRNMQWSYNKTHFEVWKKVKLATQSLILQ